MRISAWKKGALSGLLLLGLSASLWADQDLEANKKKKKQLPDGGSAVTYVLVSTAAFLGGALLVRRQRAARTM